MVAAKGGMVQTLSASTASQLTVDEVVEALQTDLQRGLTEGEANRRRAFHGFNEFDCGQKETLLQKYLEQVYTLSYIKAYSFHNKVMSFLVIV